MSATGTAGTLLPPQAQDVRPVSFDDKSSEEIPPGSTSAPAGPDVYPLDLATAIRLAGEQNPLVRFAQEQVRQAEALEEGADATWLPSLRAGVSWNRHDGSLQDTSGKIVDSDRNALYSGLGAGASGGGTPAVPGIRANFSLADAIYRPLAARQARQAQEQAAQAALNDTLLGVCLAYLELLRAVQDDAISLETLKNTQLLADLTAQYAESGQGLQSDADRMQVELSVRRNDIERSREVIAVASARLNELLNLEPNLRLQPLESVVAPWTLVVTDSTLAGLISQGLSGRPELAGSRALLGEAQQFLRREEMEPRLPTFSLGASYGDFGGGTDANLDNFRERFDLDAMAYWEMRNLGLGDQAARRAAQSRVQMAALHQSAVADRVAREITEAYAQVNARRRQIETARKEIVFATSSLKRNVLRIRNLQGLPIEVLQAIQALGAARREYLRTVIDYNAAQFSLLRAVGWRLYCIDLPNAQAQ